MDDEQGVAPNRYFDGGQWTTIRDELVRFESTGVPRDLRHLRHLRHCGHSATCFASFTEGVCVISRCLRHQQCAKLHRFASRCSIRRFSGRMECMFGVDGGRGRP